MSTSTLDFLGQANNALQNPYVQHAQQVYFDWLPFLKTLSVFVSVLLFAAALYFSIFTNWLPNRVDRVEDIIVKRNPPKRRTVKGWKRVQLSFFKGDFPHLKVAILDADKLLNEALKAAAIKGEDLGGRLKNTTTEILPNLDEVWQAHKLRNRIAHEVGFTFTRDTAERALQAYEQALKDLNILD